ncbi:uncharacterized protein CLUP02_10843 [Colletotrichum lupini]|uniref:Uncharacterized protein n=1 Tax=Colletotrichum lupini TaxID=145971 RepID=A0A9Q8SZ51_9PEZI|nr:uncharacterized protein CLUP02_10843 [Colletotrichum lupini]UQC85346.1 hypothetical protein CLUP02_10843 [Colletotrichum lupini]
MYVLLEEPFWTDVMDAKKFDPAPKVDFSCGCRKKWQRNSRATDHYLIRKVRRAGLGRKWPFTELTETPGGLSSALQSRTSRIQFFPQAHSFAIIGRQAMHEGRVCAVADDSLSTSQIAMSRTAFILPLALIGGRGCDFVVVAIMDKSQRAKMDRLYQAIHGEACPKQLIT